MREIARGARGRGRTSGPSKVFGSSNAGQPCRDRAALLAAVDRATATCDELRDRVEELEVMNRALQIMLSEAGEL